MVRHLLWLVPIGVIACAALAVALVVPTRTPHRTTRQQASQSLAEVRAALAAGQWQRAGTLAEACLQQRPTDPDVLLIAGEAATRRGALDAALQYYGRVPDADNATAATAQFSAGDIHLHRGQLTAALAAYRRAASLRSENWQAVSRAALVLMLAGRRWEAQPLLLELVQHDAQNLDQLCQFGDPQRLASDPERLTQYRAAAPSDPLPAVGLAQFALLEERPEEAETLLRKVLDPHPQLIEAQVRLGDLLARRSTLEPFLEWHRRLPAEAKTHPHYWYVCGQFAATQGDAAGASRCYWETLRREPNDQAATYQFAGLLQRLGRSADAEYMAERARRLQRVATLVNLLHDDPSNQPLLRETVALLHDLGRLWEVRAWAQVALIVDPACAWVAAEPTLLDRPPLTLPQVAPEQAPTQLVDGSRFPLPNWLKETAIPAQESPAGLVQEQPLVFDLADVGIDFQYFNSDDPATSGVRMFEFTGGGIGALDYDRDGAPDLWFTQGCLWPPDPARLTHLDRLYRNASGRFVDVTDAARLVERGFSQGIACGDFDGDGFADVYVGNFGGNRLFCNNGDGTFSDITPGSGLENGPLASVWTTSVAMADLNGDGLPDLFDVNYVQGENLDTLICGRDGVSRACNPTAFEATPDRLLLNQGDGTFSDISDRAGINGVAGNGLGVVAADFDHSGRLGLFVANDTTNNHYYVNTAPAGAPPAFSEQALLYGLAYDRDGRPQACMGVAAGDADGDGRLDLYVANYVDELNTLYRQEADGLFADVTRSVGLAEGSFKMLGFGTQFLDADLNGWEDLVVTNGHIDDFTHSGFALRMPPQVFRNSGGRFAEVPAATLGAFFQQDRLGRGLARLDWNGDGRDEFCISHLHDPATLLTNTTPVAGNAVSLRLVGVTSARDAIGATVSVDVGDRQIVRQLTAGNGYQASNEPQLTFGLGNADTARNVTVQWPAGTLEQFGPLPAGSGWLLIEGRGHPLRLKPLASNENDAPRTVSECVEGIDFSTVREGEAPAEPHLSNRPPRVHGGSAGAFPTRYTHLETALSHDDVP